MLSKIVSNFPLRSVLLSSQRSAPFSTWSTLTSAPPDPILGLNETFKKDPNPKKVLLGMGVYRDDDNKPFVLSCIRAAEKKIFERKMDHEYAGIQGIDAFIGNALKVAYGEQSQLLKDGRIAAAQSLSGTGSLRLGFEFLYEFWPSRRPQIYIPEPSWPIHKGLALRSNFKPKTYRYYDPKTKGLDFEGLKEDLSKRANKEQIVVFHVCAHNPTGVDPTQEQWKEILEIVKAKRHFVVFDSAYQGFASGDLQRDAYALNLFAESYDRIMLAQSFAKNFGVYGERVGVCSLITGDKKESEVVLSRMKQLARTLYSSPPIHGARLINTVLEDKALTEEWHSELKVMSGRMAAMRKGIVQKLKERGSPHNWAHITNQIGMFAYTGFNKEIVEELRTKYGIYMTTDGRISICGLNTKNLDYVADAFHAATKDKKF